MVGNPRVVRDDNARDGEAVVEGRDGVPGLVIAGASHATRPVQKVHLTISNNVLSIQNSAMRNEGLLGPPEGASGIEKRG